MENQYLAEAYNNRPHRIYGFRLKPFCLYYLHLLQSIDSPLLSDNKPFGPGQLLQGCEICSSAWSEEGYTLDRVLRPGPFRLHRNQLRLATEPFEAQVEAWRAYYGDYLVVAKKWEDTGEQYDNFGHLIGVKKSMGRTDLERAITTCTVIAASTGWSEKKIMMMPIGRAFAHADYFAIHGGDQKIKFITGKEEKMMARENERIKAQEKQNGAAQN